MDVTIYDLEQKALAMADRLLTELESPVDQIHFRMKVKSFSDLVYLIENLKPESQGRSPF
jgi:hypothetical protein